MSGSEYYNDSGQNVWEWVLQWQWTECLAVSITMTVDRMYGNEYYIDIVTLFSEMSAQGTMLCMFVLNFFPNLYATSLFKHLCYWES